MSDAPLRTTYPPEFRRQMVDLVRSGRTPEELAREFFAAYTFSTQTTLNQSSVSHYVVRPDGAPAWGVRLVLTLLSPN